MEYFFAMAVIILLDIYTKYKVKKILPVDNKVEIIPGKFYFWHTKNKGIAYNGFDKHTGGITAVTGAIIGGLSLFFAWLIKQPKRVAEKTAIAFIIGGAVGNFIERAKNRSVTDFLYIKKKNAPIFNIADIFIFLGGIIIIIKNCFSKG